MKMRTCPSWGVIKGARLDRGCVADQPQRSMNARDSIPTHVLRLMLRTQLRSGYGAVRTPPPYQPRHGSFRFQLLIFDFHTGR